jgi:microcystin-dependent protein
MDPFVAEIRIFPFNFAPRGWAFCNGQLIPISQNTALFSLVGTMYGGDGRSTFALPNFQGRTPIGQGQGPGLSNRSIGETGGSESVTLLQSEMPNHTHTMSQSLRPADSLNPQAQGLGTGNNVYAPSANLSAMSQTSLSPAGGGMPHNNMQPYLALNFCIAMQGVFPPRQ